MSVDQVVCSLVGLDIDVLCRDEANQALGLLRGVRAWSDSFQARLMRRLKVLAADNPAANPEADLAAASKLFRRDAQAQGHRREGHC